MFKEKKKKMTFKQFTLNEVGGTFSRRSRIAASRQFNGEKTDKKFLIKYRREAKEATIDAENLLKKAAKLYNDALNIANDEEARFAVEEEMTALGSILNDLQSFNKGFK